MSSLHSIDSSINTISNPTGTLTPEHFITRKKSELGVPPVSLALADPSPALELVENPRLFDKYYLPAKHEGVCPECEGNIVPGEQIHAFAKASARPRACAEKFGPDGKGGWIPLMRAVRFLGLNILGYVRTGRIRFVKTGRTTLKFPDGALRRLQVELREEREASGGEE